MRIKFGLYFYFGNVIDFITRFVSYIETERDEAKGEDADFVCKYLIYYHIHLVYIILMYLYR